KILILYFSRGSISEKVISSIGLVVSGSLFKESFSLHHYSFFSAPSNFPFALTKNLNGVVKKKKTFSQYSTTSFKAVPTSHHRNHISSSSFPVLVGFFVVV
ncbi:hypothetical protein VIGAN_02256300, partial [Vigna angularis var. angularis]